MSFVDIMLYIHVLAWVFWLGTDIGVFIGAKFTENAEYSVETRLTILKLAMILDMAPRIAVPVVFTTGVYLAHASYGVQVPPLGIGIGLGLVWLAVVAIGVLNPPETKLGARMQKLNLGINFIALIAMGGLGMASLLGANYFPGWLAAKWLAYAWIALFAIGIDIAFKPAVMDYMRLMTEGSTDEVNASLSKNLKPVYLTVIAVYLGTMVAAYFGLAKPF